MVILDCDSYPHTQTHPVLYIVAYIVVQTP